MNQVATDQKFVMAITPAAGAAGTADIESTIVDMAGFSTITWLIAVGPVVGSAVTSVAAQQSSANSAGGMATLVGGLVTIADDDDNQMIVIEIANPVERYQRLLVDRATQNATIGSAIAVLSNPRKGPVTNDDATVQSVTCLVSPAEV